MDVIMVIKIIKSFEKSFLVIAANFAVHIPVYTAAIQDFPTQ